MPHCKVILTALSLSHSESLLRMSNLTMKLSMNANAAHCQLAVELGHTFWSCKLPGCTIKCGYNPLKERTSIQCNAGHVFTAGRNEMTDEYSYWSPYSSALGSSSCTLIDHFGWHLCSGKCRSRCHVKSLCPVMIWFSDPIVTSRAQHLRQNRLPSFCSQLSVHPTCILMVKEPTGGF